MKLTIPTKMLTLFGIGTGMAWLLSPSAGMAAETSSLFEANPELLDYLVGGMLFVLGILSIVFLFRAAMDISGISLGAMVVPIVLTLSALITAGMNYLILGLWGEVILAAVVFNGLWLLVELAYALEFALARRF